MICSETNSQQVSSQMEDSNVANGVTVTVNWIIKPELVNNLLLLSRQCSSKLDFERVFVTEDCCEVMLI
jgi:hypothetical protein